jgi:hypothetical protein
MGQRLIDPVFPSLSSFLNVYSKDKPEAQNKWIGKVRISSYKLFAAFALSFSP